MINFLKFHYIKAQNFMRFGEEGIEIDFSKHKNIVWVTGINLDITQEDGKKASNGIGKSSLPDIIVYGLYGKSIKEIKHEDMINNRIQKNLYIEVVWDKYKVIRERKPNKLRFWESEKHEWTDANEKTLGSMAATQALIEQAVGLSYKAFVHLCVFTDNNAGSFLECDTPTKRAIVEELLNLDVYKNYLDNAKNLRKECEKKISMLTLEYDQSIREINSCNNRLSQIKQQEQDWQKRKQDELSRITLEIEQKEQKLKQFDHGADLVKYNEAQAKIQVLNESLSPLQATLEKNKGFLEEVNKKLEELKAIKTSKSTVFSQNNIELFNLQSKVKDSQKEVSKFENIKEGGKCTYCLGEVKKENYAHIIDEHKKNIIEKEQEVNVIQQKQQLLGTEIKELDEKLNKCNAMNKQLDVKITQASRQIIATNQEIGVLTKIQKPNDVSTDTKIISEQITNLLQAKNEKTKELAASPYTTMMDSTQKELHIKTQEAENKKKLLQEAESELPYYEFWVQGFGDNGIRKFVISDIIPTLNQKLAHWLQFLIDGKFKIVFDSELNETITNTSNPNGDPFVYFALSGGEKRRMNLAVSQAFAHIMMLASGASPSILFLDEITSNIDPHGIECVYNMIIELAKNKQVFITTHDKEMQELLLDHDKIFLERKNDFTKLVQK